MAFYMRNYTSEEKFDLAKFMNFENGVFDVINSPFLAQLSQLPTVKYYNVDEGAKDIDLISYNEYGDLFFAPLIQFYNNDHRETFPEGTILKLFSIEALNELYYKLATSSNGTVIDG